tara:strand:- start:226 stop:882 length:657 start_codon:yes stop_codon:yes gene_type:complete
MSISADTQELNSYINNKIDIESVASFKGNEHIIKLNFSFDINLIREALDEIKEKSEFKTGPSGFHALAMTKRPGHSVDDDKDLVGRYYTRVDESYQEISKDELVDESAFTELVDVFKGTYFETIHQELSARYPIGRVRILEKSGFNCNSWHRDPEPRIHIPIVTNPGALFIVNHHCTHLPADGSVYFTDTRGYHTALNGSDQPRTHLVAALAYPEYQP